ncbi:hypothetical protein B566_EDAN014471 [Ephemera danica]|nr:hypothetical protein B566_EDAN014471 [Ephemera danica]
MLTLSYFQPARVSPALTLESVANDDNGRTKQQRDIKILSLKPTNDCQKIFNLIGLLGNIGCVRENAEVLCPWSAGVRRLLLEHMSGVHCADGRRANITAICEYSAIKYPAPMLNSGHAAPDFAATAAQLERTFKLRGLKLHCCFWNLLKTTRVYVKVPRPGICCVCDRGVDRMHTNVNIERNSWRLPPDETLQVGDTRSKNDEWAGPREVCPTTAAGRKHLRGHHSTCMRPRHATSLQRSLQECQITASHVVQVQVYQQMGNIQHVTGTCPARISCWERWGVGFHGAADQYTGILSPSLLRPELAGLDSTHARDCTPWTSPTHFLLFNSSGFALIECECAVNRDVCAVVLREEEGGQVSYTPWRRAALLGCHGNLAQAGRRTRAGLNGAAASEQRQPATSTRSTRQASRQAARQRASESSRPRQLTTVTVHTGVAEKRSTMQAGTVSDSRGAANARDVEDRGGGAKNGEDDEERFSDRKKKVRVASPCPSESIEITLLGRILRQFEVKYSLPPSIITLDHGCWLPQAAALAPNNLTACNQDAKEVVGRTGILHEKQIVSSAARTRCYIGQHKGE